jgi:O-antigen/teichoic acid export membrane protein
MHSSIKTSSEQSNIKTKRIASNSMVLFARMIVVTIVNLYTVRWVLNGLGVIDYGIYNAIAGVVTTSTCLSSVLALSTQRFYSFAMGKGDFHNLQNIFSVSLNMVIILSVAIIIIFSIVGPWLINTQMIIPNDRLHAAYWMFFFSILTFIFGIFQIPFMGAVFAHEDMGFYALVSTADCFMKLLVAYTIGHTSIDNLVFYGAGLAIVASLVFLSYTVISYKKYPECHYKFVKEKKLFKELLSFSGWTFYGSMAGVSLIQGNIILLNVFFGPVINAAFAIGNQIYNAINTLNNSTVLAFRPAMTKAYSGHEYKYLNQLFSAGNKIMFYLLICVTIPFLFETNNILEIWLGSERVTMEMLLFSKLFIIYTLCLALQSPITIIIQATGRIRNYSICVESLLIICLPINYILFKFGLAPYWIFITMIGFCIAAHIIRLIFLKYYYTAFSFRQYLFSFVLPASTITTITTITIYYLHNCIEGGLLRFIAVCIVSTIITLALAYKWGISKEERTQAKLLILKKIRKK